MTIGKLRQLSSSRRRAHTKLDDDCGSDSGKDIALTLSEHVRVVVRCRPLNVVQEKSAKEFLRILDDGRSIEIRDSVKGMTKYEFICVADETKDHQFLYENTGKQIVECALDGFNGAIVAYGQTGSGKTFTMQGPGLIPGLEQRAEPPKGIIQSVCETLYEHIRVSHKPGIVEYAVSASYLEIYNERLVDLLSGQKTGRSPQLSIREDSRGEILVVGQKSVPVQSENDCYEVLQRGGACRSTAATNMNSESSRSHAIFTLRIEKIDCEEGTRRTSRLHLVDLAGSERQKSTGASGARLREASGINKSLSALGNVINALSTIEKSEGGAVHRVPSCRDSKLTFLLKDSLGGNSKLCLIATISPALSSLEETLSTLEFAKRCAAVRNEAVVNEHLSSNVATLHARIRQLEEHLQILRTNAARSKALDHGAASAKEELSGMRFADSTVPQATKRDFGCQTDFEPDNFPQKAYVCRNESHKLLLDAVYPLLDETLQGNERSAEMKKLCTFLADFSSRETKSREQLESLRDEAQRRQSQSTWEAQESRDILKCREYGQQEIDALVLKHTAEIGGTAFQNEYEIIRERQDAEIAVMLEENETLAVERREIEDGEQSLAATTLAVNALEKPERRAVDVTLREENAEIGQIWQEMLHLNEEMVDRLSKTSAELHKVRTRGLQEAYGAEGEHLREDLDRIRQEALNDPEKMMLKHKVKSLENELIELVELSAEAQKEQEEKNRGREVLRDNLAEIVSCPHPQPDHKNVIRKSRPSSTPSSAPLPESGIHERPCDAKAEGHEKENVTWTSQQDGASQEREANDVVMINQTTRRRRNKAERSCSKGSLTREEMMALITACKTNDELDEVMQRTFRYGEFPERKAKFAAKGLQQMGESVSRLVGMPTRLTRRW